jgi:hypothetical protein
MRSRRLSADLASLLLGGLSVASSSIVGCVLGLDQALAACELHSRGGRIDRIVQIQFENLHLGRDEPNVPSDLEQMPRLREFFASDGTLGSSRQSSPFTQRASDVLTVLTGLLGDRMGVPLGDSYGTFQGDGGVKFTSAFGYWTARGGDGRPLMLADTGKTTPAPWVPFTRAGCDVGAVAVNGLTLQQINAEIADVLGASDAEAARRDPVTAAADLLGISIHCARGSPLCSNAHSRPDLLPDEPGGYAGFYALFGRRHVQPILSSGRQMTGPSGKPVADNSGNAGFPGMEATAAQSLGYAAAMLEAGVHMVYVSIGDTHKRNGQGRASAPGEADHVARLADDDASFGSFVDRLAAGGITKRNTLFVAVSTGNDRFIGGPPQPPGCDGIRQPCSYGPAGAIEASMDRLLASQHRNVSVFEIQPGSAVPFYLRGNPLPADPLTRTLEQDVGKLAVRNPMTGNTDRLAAGLADRAQMQIMHLVTASPARTPSFVMSGDPNYLYRMAASRADCSTPPACVAVDPDTVWTRGNVQPIASSGWFGIAGPGVAHLGQVELPSYHADLRPTILALVGLRDSYVHDGVVLADVFENRALPAELSASRDIYTALARAYWTINAPLGPLGRAGLALAGQSIKSGDVAYQRYLDAIGIIRQRRDMLVQDIKAQLDGAAFAHQPIASSYAAALVARAETLVNDIEELAARSLGPADRPWKAASDAH